MKHRPTTPWKGEPHRVLPRFFQRELRHEARRRTDPPPASSSRSAPPNPGDLRGIPVIARGVGGTQPGSDPLRQALRNAEKAAKILDTKTA